MYIREFIGSIADSEPQSRIFRASNLGTNEAVCRLKKYVFGRSGSKMVAGTEKETIANAGK
jgi:hypothetical protein